MIEGLGTRLEQGKCGRAWAHSQVFPNSSSELLALCFLHTARDPNLEPGGLGMRLGGLWADQSSNLVAVVRGRTVIAG